MKVCVKKEVSRSREQCMRPTGKLKRASLNKKKKIQNADVEEIIIIQTYKYFFYKYKKPKLKKSFSIN